MHEQELQKHDSITQMLDQLYKKRKTENNKTKKNTKKH